MRIRTIKPEFFNHEGIYEAEIETGMPLRVAFIGLWCAADREGRFRWEPRRLGVQIMPYDDCEFSRVLDALTTRGFVVRYRVDDACFGCIPSFPKHQVINNRESASSLPEMTDENAESLALSRESDACPTRAPRDDHACQGEGKGREGKGTLPQSRKEEDLGFAEFWEAYPKKVNKIDAAELWKKLAPNEHMTREIIAAVQKRKLTDEWVKEGGKFIMGPDKFLRKRRWEDLIDAIETRETIANRLRSMPGYPSHIGHSNATEADHAAYAALLARYKALPE